MIAGRRKVRGTEREVGDLAGSGCEKEETKMSAGFMIGQIEVTDPEAYKEYAAKVPATIAKFDGEYLVRGGEMEVLEGEWADRRMVVVKFPSLERAREWYFSPEYEPLKALRQRASVGNVMFVDGI